MQHILDLGRIPRNYYRYVDPKLWADPITPESTPERRNSYAIERICGYESARAFDEDLFFLYQEDFEGWTITHFAALNVDIRRFLKDTLRTRGVYTGPKKAKTQLALANLAVAEELPEWHAEEAAEILFDERSKQWTRNSSRKGTGDQPKKTYWNPDPREQQNPDNNLYPTTRGPSQATPLSRETSQLRGDQNVMPKTEPTPQSSNKGTGYPVYTPLSLINVANEQITIDQLTSFNRNFPKTSTFSGDLYDLYDEKVQEFVALCETIGIRPPQMHTVFPYMLTGDAKEFYRLHVNKNDSFAEAYQKIKNHFHENRNLQRYLQDWTSMTFRSVQREDPDKSYEEILDTLVRRLESCRVALGESYRPDILLKDAVARACNGIPELAIGLAQNTSTVRSHELINNLRYSARTYETMRMNTPMANLTMTADDPAEVHYTDRRYTKFKTPSSSRSGSTGRGRTRSRGNFRSNRFQGRGKKVCYICGKPDCWSTNHSKEERRKKYDEYRKSDNATYFGEEVEGYHTFLAQFEGVNEGEEGSTDDEEDFGEEEADLFFVQDETREGAAKIQIPDDEETAFQFLLEDRYSSEQFQGIIPDTGAAALSTAGIEQYHALRSKYPDILPLDETRAEGEYVKFGKGAKTRSLGTVTVPTQFGEMIFHVIHAPTPFLLCIDDMDRLRVLFDNINNLLIQQLPGGKSKAIPVTRRWGHPWLSPDTEPITQQGNNSFLTDTELRRLHRRFGHPASARLARLLSNAGEPGNWEALQAIEDLCHQCQTHTRKPSRFRFNLKDDQDVRFNSEIIVDIMYLNADGNKPVLHVVDQTTAFQGGQFLPSSSAKDVWETLRMTWIDTYQGPPDTITHDAGTAFTAAEFQANAGSLDIKCHAVPVEAHNSIGMVERYHAPLRRVFEILYAELSGTTSKEAILQMAFKAINDTVGPEGIVPTLLVFGDYPRITAKSDPPPTVQQRSKAIAKAMRALQQIRAKRQVRDAINTRNGPSNADITSLPLRSEVLVWRENRGWQGPYQILSIDDQDVVLDLPNGPTTFRSTSLKPYFRDLEPEPRRDYPQAPGPTDSRCDYPQAPEPTDPPEPPAVRRRGRPRGSKNKRNNNAEEEEREEEAQDSINVAFFTKKEEQDAQLAIQLRKEGKITTPGRPFEASATQEIDNLLARGVFRFEEFDEDKHGGIRVFTTRLVNEVKGKTTQPYEKSRLVVAGHSDEEKHTILTQSPTIQRSSQRLITSLATPLIRRGYKLAIRDITQAYVQATSDLNRPILARLPDQLRDRYPPGTIIRVVKPLYGIAEAGVHWFVTYHDHHTQKLGMASSTYDQCLLITNQKEDSFGIVGLQTDDTLILGDQTFLEAEQRELRKAGFTAKPRTELTVTTSLEFNGGRLTLEGDVIVYRQKDQAAKLSTVPRESDPTYLQRYVEQRARGAYIASLCQPEAAYDLAIAAQTTTPGADDITQLNKRIQWQMDNAERGLRYVDIDLRTAKLITFADGSHGSNKDLSSQLGYVTMIGNETRRDHRTVTFRGNIIHWQSAKIKRVVRSSLAAEIYAVATASDLTIAISTTLQRITDRLGFPKIPFTLCTDSQSLYDHLNGLKTTKEKRLMMETIALREAYENREIDEILWIPGKGNPADALTKTSARANGALRDLVSSNEITIQLDGYISRPIQRKHAQNRPSSTVPTETGPPTEEQQQSTEHTRSPHPPSSAARQRLD